MFKTRRRSPFKTSHRRGYSRFSRSQRPSLNRWQFAAIVVLALIALELATRITLGFLGNPEGLESSDDSPVGKTDYGLSYHHQNGLPYTALDHQGALKVKNNPLKGYELIANQTSNVWKINEQGFRASASLSPEKASDEIRIFVLGGSAAFGQGSSNNEATFASQLQLKLNQQVADQTNNPNKYRPVVLPYFADEQAKALQKPAPILNKQYRVINAAVPGYASGNELTQLVDNVILYKPDLVILVNGYSDLLLPSDESASTIPQIDALLSNPAGHLSAIARQRAQDFFNKSLLIKTTISLIFQSSENSSALSVLPGSTQANLQLPETTEELEKRVQRYTQNLRKIATVTSSMSIPLIVAVQPEVTSRLSHKITDSEQDIVAQLGKDYPDNIRQGYQLLRAGVDLAKNEFPGKVLPLTLEDLYVDTESKVFYDPVHLTDEANRILAEKFYGAISSRLRVESKPYSGAQLSL